MVADVKRLSCLILAVFLVLPSLSPGQLISITYDTTGNEIPYTPPKGILIKSTPASSGIGTEVASTFAGAVRFQRFTIANTSGQDLNLSISLANSSDAFGLSANSLSIGVGKTSNFSLAFAPVSFGEFENRVEITSDASPDEPFHFDISGRTPAGAITFTSPDGNEITPGEAPTTGNKTIFTAAVDGSSEIRDFVITNSGDETIEISATVPAGTRSLTPTESELDPGETLTLRLEVPLGHNRDPGSYDSSLNVFLIREEGSPAALALYQFRTVIVATPIIQLERVRFDNSVVPATSPLQLGQFELGVTSPSQNIRLTNVGTGSLSVTSLVNSEPAFSLALPALPASVAPGGTLEFSITFTPDQTGISDGQLLLTSDELGSETILTTRGVGVAAELNFLTEDFIDNGFSTSVGVPLTKEFRFTNGSPLVALEISAIELLDDEGLPVPGFSVASFPAEVPAARAGVISITYRPTSSVNRGSFSARIVSNVEGGETLLRLRPLPSARILPIDGIRADGGDIELSLPAYEEFTGGIVAIGRSTDLITWSDAGLFFTVGDAEVPTFREAINPSRPRAFYRVELRSLPEN